MVIFRGIDEPFGELAGDRKDGIERADEETLLRDADVERAVFHRLLVDDVELVREDLDRLVVGTHLLGRALLVLHVGVKVAVELEDVLVAAVELDDAVEE